MEKTYAVKITKCLLILTEPELMGCLALQPDIFERAIGRGKRILRAQATAKRQAPKRFGVWELYEALKGNPRYLTLDSIRAVEAMPAEDIRQGVIEYLSAECRG